MLPLIPRWRKFAANRFAGSELVPFHNPSLRQAQARQHTKAMLHACVNNGNLCRDTCDRVLTAKSRTDADFFSPLGQARTLDPVAPPHWTQESCTCRDTCDRVLTAKSPAYRQAGVQTLASIREPDDNKGKNEN